MNDLNELIKEKILVLDGAMGCLAKLKVPQRHFGKFGLLRHGREFVSAPARRHFPMTQIEWRRGATAA